MFNFKSFLKEEANQRHGVLAYGRMNPPTIGHAKLVDKVHEVANQHEGAIHSVVLSHSQDAKKNPLSVEQKVKHAKKAFPNTNIVGASKDKPTIMHHASDMYDSGARHLHVIAGSDRVEEYKKLLHNYNGKEGKHGYYNFKTITIHSAGERDPDAEGAEGMSASKMREHATNGNEAEFHKGLPDTMSKKDKSAVYHDVRKGMGHE
jgi:hypothetical protein